MFASKDFTLGQMNALVKKIGKGNVLPILDGTLRFELVQPPKPVNPPLLEPLGAITVPGHEEPFVTRDHFKKGDVEGVVIGYVSDNFRSWFLDKVEESQGETEELRYAKLTKNSLDKPILKELGENAETTLTEIWQLMRKHGRGQDGVLLTNWSANIFYVRDQNNVLRAVRVHWHSDHRYWSVYANSVESPYEWHAGNRVFSRNC